MKILFDTDPGADDAIALLWLLALDASYHAKLVGVTTAAGNVRRELTFANACRLLKMCHRQDIVVGRGVAAIGADASRVHGSDGLGGLAKVLPSLERDYADAPRSDRMIVDSLQEDPGEITIIAVGPLSNLAAAENSCPGILASAKEVVIMGGAIGKGNVTESAEFNAYCDPVAWQKVIDCSKNVSVVPLNVTRKIRLSVANVAAAGLDSRTGKVGEFVEHLCRAMARRARRRGIEGGFMIHDAAAVARCFYPETLRLAPAKLNIVTDSGAERGRTSVARYGKSNVELARSVNPDVLARRLLRDLVQLGKRVI